MAISVPRLCLRTNSSPLPLVWPLLFFLSPTPSSSFVDRQNISDRFPRSRVTHITTPPKLSWSLFLTLFYRHGLTCVVPSCPPLKKSGIGTHIFWSSRCSSVVFVRSVLLAVGVTMRQSSIATSFKTTLLPQMQCKQCEEGPCEEERRKIVHCAAGSHHTQAHSTFKRQLYEKNMEVFGRAYVRISTRIFVGTY